MKNILIKSYLSKPEEKLSKPEEKLILEKMFVKKIAFFRLFVSESICIKICIVFMHQNMSRKHNTLDFTQNHKYKST